MPFSYKDLDELEVFFSKIWTLTLPPPSLQELGLKKYVYLDA